MKCTRRKDYGFNTGLVPRIACPLIHNEIISYEPIPDMPITKILLDNMVHDTIGITIIDPPRLFSETDRGS